MPDAAVARQVDSQKHDCERSNMPDYEDVYLDSVKCL